MSINRVFISGYLTRDPELRVTSNGTPVLSFGVAVNDPRKNQQTGEWEDYPNFLDCTMFGTRAESISRFLSKGSKVAIEGKLHWSQWEQEDGNKRSRIQIIINTIEFMSARKKNQSVTAPEPEPTQGEPSQQQMAGMPDPQPQSIYDSDIPF